MVEGILTCRPIGRFLCFWAAFLVLATPLLAAASPQTTTLTDVVYRADGKTAAGSIVITWPAFTTSDGKAVAAGTTTVNIGSGGAVSIPFVPNEGATPTGTSYKVVLKLDDGTTEVENWVVPRQNPTTIAAVRAKIVPASQALTQVPRSYVDAQLVAKADDSRVVHSSGDETVNGVKQFAISPIVPSPGSNGAAANRADTAVAGAGSGVPGLRDASRFGTIQAAINDAGTTGSVMIPSTYTGTDSYTNPNLIAIDDRRPIAARRDFDLKRDFGCKGDNVADDTACIQSALDTASGQNKVVHLECSPGTYRVTNQLTYIGNVGAGVKIIGKAPSTRGLMGCTIRYDGPMGGTLLYFLGANNSQLVDVELNGNNKARTTWYIDATGDFGGNSTANITSISRAANLVTVNFASSLAFNPGEPIQVAGVSPSTFNGTWRVWSVVGGTQVTFLQSGNDINGRGGTATRYSSPISSGVKMENAVLAGFKGTGMPISSISTTSGVMTVTTATPHGLSKLDLVHISGVAPSRLSTSFKEQAPGDTSTTCGSTLVTAVLSPTQFTTSCAGADTAGSGGTVVPGSQAILMAHTLAGTPQVSEISLRNILLQGDGSGNSIAGILALNIGNTKNFRLSGMNFNGTRIGVSGLASGMVYLDGPVFSVMDADLNGVMDATIVAGESECTGCRHLVCTTGSGTGAISEYGFQWQSAAPPDDFMIKCTANLTLIGGKYYNVRTGSSMPKIMTAVTYVNGAPGAFTSIGSYYMNATGYVPVYDASGNYGMGMDAGKFFENKTASIVSINDIGGANGPVVKLKPVVSVDTLTPYLVNYSTTPIASVGSAFIRLNETLNGIAYRKHADDGDVVALRKGTDDVVQCGDSAGMRPGSGVTFSALPAGVGNGTMIYCSDCAVAASCTGGGTGAIAKRLNNAWVCN